MTDEVTVTLPRGLVEAMASDEYLEMVSLAVENGFVFNRAARAALAEPVRRTIAFEDIDFEPVPVPPQPPLAPPDNSFRCRVLDEHGERCLRPESPLHENGHDFPPPVPVPAEPERPEWQMFPLDLKYGNLVAERQAVLALHAEAVDNGFDMIATAAIGRALGVTEEEQ